MIVRKTLPTALFLAAAMASGGGTGKRQLYTVRWAPKPGQWVKIETPLIGTWPDVS